MLKKSSKNVFSRIKEKGAMGVVQDVLATSKSSRTMEHYQQTKKQLLLFPSGEVTIATFKQLEEVLDNEEVILVVFSKNKTNGKVGHQKEFQEGFCYYVGTNPEKLSKVYVHWNEEKKFLLQNIACLNSKLFFVAKHINECIPGIFCLTISLFNSEKKTVMEAEISLYIGYK